MPFLTVQEIKEKIINLQTGIYFLCGDEDYFGKNIIEILQKEKRFITFINADKTSSLEAIVNEFCQGSLFDKEKIIVVRNLQDSKLVNKIEIEHFLSVLTNLNISNTTHNLLLFLYNKKISKKDGLYTSLERFNCFVGNKLSPQQLGKFITGYCREKGIEITNDILTSLIENISSLEEVVRVIDVFKHKNNLREGNKILNTVTHEKAFDSFEFMLSLANKSPKRLQDMFRSLKNISSSEAIPLCSMLYTFFLKTLNAFNPKSSPSFLYKIATRNYSQEKILNILNKLKFLDESLKGMHANTSTYTLLLYILNSIVKN